MHRSSTDPRLPIRRGRPGRTQFPRRTQGRSPYTLLGSSRPIIATDPHVSVKTILIAHQSPAIRERFAAALAEARHTSVAAATESRVLPTLPERPARTD